MIGKTISHYKIQEKLGQGGMGTVFLAEDTRLDRKAALKFLPKEYTEYNDARERFKREARATAALNHPNIVTIYETSDYEDQTFIAMEYVDGETLKDKISREGKQPSLLLDETDPLHTSKINELIKISIQICEGLEDAHIAGIIHRDIKPANIIIDKKDRVKILDFGLAKLKGASQLTMESTILGTVHYMSPEQVQGKEADSRTDIWSLGVLFYEMLTGQLPFTGEYPQAIMYAIVNEDPEPLSALNQFIPSELEVYVNKMLQKEPVERYQKAEQILSDLKSLSKKLKPDVEKEKDSETSKPSVAVLPFLDMSPEKDQEYFCDGVAEELINELTNTRDLHVVARTSAFAFKGTDTDIRDIGKKLNVTTVLEGSVRKAGNRLRITAQLINVSDGYHIWSQKYDRDFEDIFAIQDEIAQKIGNKLKSSLNLETKKRKERYSRNLEAYEFYLRGLYYWNKFSSEWLEKAIGYFRKAIEKDPHFALAYAALAEVHVFQATAFALQPPRDAMPKAKAAAEKALQLDPNLPEAHAALGLVATFFEWDSEKAKKCFRQSITLNPNYAGAHLMLEFPLSLLDNNFDEAIIELTRALELDPLNLLVRLRIGYIYIYKYDYDRAVDEFQKTLDVEPNYAPARSSLMCAYGQKGMYDKALSEGEKALAIAGPVHATIGNMGYYCGRAGKETQAMEYLSILLDQAKNGIISPFWIAGIYLGLNEIDSAFEWLNKALNQRDSNLLYIMVPIFDPIRKDTRYKELLKKMGVEK